MSCVLNIQNMLTTGCYLGSRLLATRASCPRDVIHVNLTDIRFQSSRFASEVPTLTYHCWHAEGVPCRSTFFTSREQANFQLFPTMMSSDHIQLSFEKAFRAYTTGEFAAALHHLENVLPHDPQHYDAMHLRGQIALKQNDLEQAEIWLTQVIRLKPHPLFYNSLCVIQTRKGAFASAAESARAGLSMHDQCRQDLIVMLLYNLGVALQSCDLLQQAVNAYRLAAALDPLHSECRNNLSTCLNALGDLNGAIEVLRESVVLNPDNHAARSNLGHSLLAAGQFSEGWRYCEDRWAAYQVADGPFAFRPADLPIPRWLGQTVANNARLLVLSEQGLGDMLQFCRYLPMALTHFRAVAFVCPKPLRRLLNDSLCASNPGLTLLNAMPADLQQWDWYCPMLSLPLAFDTRLDTIPADLPYLRSNPLVALEWATRINAQHADRRPRIGLVWAGGHSGTVLDRRRSVAVDEMARLLAWPHAQWISLQKAETAEKQLSREHHPNVIDWMDDVEDFADTAALIESLDLVISVDTSVAHLAAAMGKRVWLLNRYAGCWRWLRNRDDSPWYPGLRIFTQRTRGEWTAVLDHVLLALEREYR